MNPDQIKISGDSLETIISSSKIIWDILQRAETLNIPNWHIGAGCIAQTIWNHFHGFDPSNFITDIDFVYFDDSDLSFEKENEVIKKVNNSFKDSPIPLDVKNQARVHLWYRDHFGYDIKPYQSIHDAVNTWPTTATSIAVKLEKGRFNIYAPFGLNDLFKLVVRANKRQITEEIYTAKINRWKKHWPRLNIIPW